MSLLKQTVYGQKIDYKYNEHLWQEITLAKQDTRPELSDTMLVMCTVRGFDSTSTRLFNDRIDPDTTIRYLLVVRKHNRWTLYRMNSLDEAASFLKQGEDVVFYVEGMGKTFTTNLYRGAGMAVQYHVKSILFDYPSADPSYNLLRNFRFSRNNSSAVYYLYAEWLRAIQASKSVHATWINDVHTTLFHHSMGNRMLERAITSNSITDIKDSLVHSLVMNAPCVRSRNHCHWVSKIQFASDVMVNYNKQDRQLRGAGLYTFQKQLGNIPRPSFASNVVYVDLNKIAGNKHNLFLNRPGRTDIPERLYSFYDAIFHGYPIQWSNADLFLVGNRIPGYSIKPGN